MSAVATTRPALPHASSTVLSVTVVVLVALALALLLLVAPWRDATASPTSEPVVDGPVPACELTSVSAC